MVDTLRVNARNEAVSSSGQRGHLQLFFDPSTCGGDHFEEE